MRTFRVTLTLLSALMLGLTMTSTASAVAVDVVNGDFQTQHMEENWSDDVIHGWYDHTPTDGRDKLFMDEVTDTGDYSYGAGSTTVCEFTNNWNGYIYQQIGTYTENELIEVTGTMLRRDHHDTGMLRFTLHVGNGTPADDYDVVAFTGLVDTVHVVGSDLSLTATGGSGPGGSPYDSPAASASFTTTLDSGTGHTVGDPIWLRVTADFDSWAVVAVDNIALPGAKSADLNTDRWVDEADVTELTTKWGLREIDGGWDAAYDLDGSLQIGFGDLTAIRKKWYPNPSPSAGAASVPEPCSMALLLMGSLALLVLRRRCRV